LKRAFLNLRLTNRDRVELYAAGLRRHGFKVIPGVTFSPGPQDLLVTWNRIGVGHTAACKFEQAGLPVVVTENATWGNEFAGFRWYTLARNWHNRVGCFQVGGPERWDSLGVELVPFRDSGETVVLPQRGIGAGGMPKNWTAPGRVRKHPGKGGSIPLEKDLANAGKVVTWGSGAAVKALMMGIRVESHMPGWIAEQDNTDQGRLEMFRRLAWAQWRLEEIASGYAFERVLS
jgi:hypothetical protein